MIVVAGLTSPPSPRAGSSSCWLLMCLYGSRVDYSKAFLCTTCGWVFFWFWGYLPPRVELKPPYNYLNLKMAHLFAPFHYLYCPNHCNFLYSIFLLSNKRARGRRPNNGVFPFHSFFGQMEIPIITHPRESYLQPLY